MKKLAVIGPPEFTLGFQLAGIREVITFTKLDKEETTKQIHALLTKADIGIVIADEETMNSLDEQTKADTTVSLSPVFIIVSRHSQQEELRKMIKQSIGVDLMKEA